MAAVESETRNSSMNLPAFAETDGPRNAHHGRWRVRCTVTAKSTGERCKRWAIRGHHVCPKHGGQLPSVKARAAKIFAGLRDAAIDEIERELQPWAYQKVRARAARDVLRLTTPPGSLPSTGPDEKKVDALLERLSRERGE